MFRGSQLATLVVGLLLAPLTGCNLTPVKETPYSALVPITFQYKVGDADYKATVCSNSFTVVQGGDGPQIIIVDGWILIDGVNPIIGTEETIAGSPAKVAKCEGETATADLAIHRFLLVHTDGGLDVVTSEVGATSIVGREAFNDPRADVPAGQMKGSRQNFLGNKYCDPATTVQRPTDLTLPLDQLLPKIAQFKNDLENTPCHDN